MKTRQLLIVVMFLFASAVPVRADDQAAFYDSIKNRAAQGFAPAQFNLGVMYHNGEGVPQDSAEAFKWYGLAAAQGETKAQVKLGAMYVKGWGVPQDDTEALKWYRPAGGESLWRHRHVHPQPGVCLLDVADLAEVLTPHYIPG